MRRHATCGDWRRAMLAAALLLIVAAPAAAAINKVTVVDAVSGAPIKDAVVTVGEQVMRSDDKGVVALAEPAASASVRAIGYGRITLEDAGKTANGMVARLPAFKPKALYLSFYGIGDAKLRADALRLVAETELNALVIDVKGDRGRVPYPSSVELATQVGAQKTITVRDIRGLLATLHAQGIYTVARVVTFKDDPFARAHPEWAVHTRDGKLWSDREGLAWSDPFRREAWDYVLDIAAEAARLGFDEVQFDYVRFPDEPGLVFAQDATEAARVKTITAFLSAAAARLAPYNVFVSADLFGYTLWNKDDTGIGQRLEDLAPKLDYISPMLYPSSFQFGIPGYADPVAHPYEVVGLSLRNAQKRTGLPATRFRPWLQAFHDYAFDHRNFGATEIAAQVKAAEEFGGDGWMLWNPRNVYGADGLKQLETKK